MLTVDKINPAVQKAEYAVRGEIALRAEEWKQAISEIYRTLKPGGHAQFLEYSYHRPEPSPARKQFSKLLRELYAYKGLLCNIGELLPSWLKEAGFVNIVMEADKTENAAWRTACSKLFRTNLPLHDMKVGG